MAKIILLEKHSAWIRWTHWLNFPLLALMVWSGTLIYWANDVYRPFFPDWFYGFFGIPHRLAEGMAIHFSVMWPFVLNGIVHFVFLGISGEWRHLAPGRGSLKKAVRVALHDLGLIKQAPPQGKFNDAQRIAYSGVLLMGVMALLSGLAIYKPVQLHLVTSVFGGYEIARGAHFALAIGFVLFFFVHVIQVIRAGWENFRSMVAGFEVKKSEQ